MTKKELPTRRPKCPECNGQGSHRAYCSQNPRYPTPERKSPPREDKRNPITRENDGRRRRG